MATMRGRQVFMAGLVEHGVTAIFGNPGTTENPLLDTLLDYPQLPYYVALHEGVATGAATFHSHATGRPSVVNLHVAPGLGNAIGMIYGALKSNAPLLVTAGQQDTRMRLRDPLLSHDLVAMAQPVVKWAAEPRHADEIAPMLAEALQVAMTPPRGPVFMSMPVDVFADFTDVSEVSPLAIPRAGTITDTDLSALITLLKQSRAPAVLAGDDVTAHGANEALLHVVEQLGASVYLEGLRTHANFPNRHPAFAGRIPFESSNVRSRLATHDLILMIGGTRFEEIWHDDVAPIPDGVPLVRLEQSAGRLQGGLPTQLSVVADLNATLTTISQQLDQPTPMPPTTPPSGQQSGWDTTPMTPARALHELATALPEDIVVVDESITAYPNVEAAFDFAAPHSYYAGRGGGIGQGLAGAIGTQVAHPDRRVVAISGDGSAMYSAQAFWSAAHHELPIIFVILANREYRVLKHNLDIYRARFEAESNRPYPHMDLDSPQIDFVQTAGGQGVPGVRVESPDGIERAVQDALQTKGPFLIELAVSGKR